MKEFQTAIEEVVTEAEGGDPAEKPTEFALDGVILHAYSPTPGQLTFMLASLGRGQTKDARFGSIVNIIMECLDENDKDYFESRLLTRDPKRMIPIKTMEAIFEYLMEEWFARPTQPPSDSAPSQPNGGTNSTPSTTPSPQG